MLTWLVQWPRLRVQSVSEPDGLAAEVLQMLQMSWMAEGPHGRRQRVLHKGCGSLGTGALPQGESAGPDGRESCCS